MRKTLVPAAISAVALLAQTPHTVEEKQFHITGAPGPGSGAFTFMSAEMSFETVLVKGVPFTGDFVTGNSQALADGNRIKNSNTTAYARDGEGRTRREITIDAIGPFTGGEARKTIFIHDPIAKIDYVLDPRAKTARKIDIGATMSNAPAVAGAKVGQGVFFNRRIEGPADGGNIVFQRRTEGAKDVVIEHGGTGPAIMESMPLPPGIAMHGQAGAVIGQRVRIAEAGGGTASAVNFKNEPLGKRMIEGVEAEGTRTTLTIPAGQIGNEHPLDTVSERWYSNELKTIVMTTRKDPRTGESTYRLANLRRGEPSRLLFEVPAGYQVIEEPAGPPAMRMRVEKKQE